jgi:peptidoglycan glycosyltransferase
MNRQIRRLTLALLVCYVLLFAQLNRLQVVDAHSLNTNPTNTRQVVRDFTRPRGPIVTADGVTVAESVPSNDRYKLQRTYPLGDLFGQITGYFSFKYGSAGVEKQYNDILAGQTSEQKIGDLSHLFDDSANVGTVKLTLRADIQKAAREALGNKEGSVVVMDPRTGALLALWSNPSYDPNSIASHDFAKAGEAKALYDLDPRKPLLANSYQERYMPGSTFKIVTATAGLETGTVNPQTTFPVERSWVPPHGSPP